MYSLKQDPSNTKISSKFNEISKQQHLKCLNSQSPKFKHGKIRPGSQHDFSLLDYNEKKVKKGTKVNRVYQRELLYSMFPDYYKRPTSQAERSTQRMQFSKTDSNFFKPLDQDQKCNANETHTNSKVTPLQDEYYKPHVSEYNIQWRRIFDNATRVAKGERLSIENRVRTAIPLMRREKVEVEVKDRPEQDRVDPVEALGDYSRHPKLTKVKFPAGKKDYRKSDIFNLDEKYSQTRTFETYTVPGLIPRTKPFSVSTKSNSEWSSIMENKKANLMNHASTDFHVLRPDIRNISRTKKEIEESNSYSIARKNMLSEFIDLTRVGCPNPNKFYRLIAKQDMGAFRRTSDVCTLLLDGYVDYKGLIAEPFKTNKKLK